MEDEVDLVSAMRGGTDSDLSTTRDQSRGCTAKQQAQGNAKTISHGREYMPSLKEL
jgi:hypothetical protein